MPKSRGRKRRYIPRQKTAPKPGATAGLSAQTSVAQPAPSPRPNPVTAPRSAQPAIKGPSTEQLKYVGTELKVVGILSLVMIAAIVVLYFLLR